MRIQSRQKQQGVSLGGLLIALFIVVIIGIVSLKLIPGYIEYAKAKAAIEAIAADRGRSGSVAEVRKAFDARAVIDDIANPKAGDLEITKEGGNVVISFAYRKEFPLVANIGLYIDFAASSGR
jgi:Domain of unknown function (DUF4845)